MPSPNKTIVVAALALGAVVVAGTGTALAARIATAPARANDPVASAVTDPTTQTPAPAVPSSGSAPPDGANEVDVAVTGTELERASAVALAHTGQGRVSDTEVGDEDSYYEIEVTLDDGSQVDVQLDKAFNVVSAAADVETSDGP